MNVITLRQPHATLVMAGIKKATTRKWPPRRGAVNRILGIHAGKKNPLFETEYLDGWEIPTGAVLGHATLRGYCQVAKYSKEAGMFKPDTSHYMFHTFWPEHRNKEVFFQADPFGDYSEGRWVWFLDEVVCYKVPIPSRGHHDIWKMPSPYDGKWE